MNIRPNSHKRPAGRDDVYTTRRSNSSNNRISTGTRNSSTRRSSVDSGRKSSKEKIETTRTKNNDKSPSRSRVKTASKERRKLPAYGVPKAVAAALQALPAVLPAVALPALRKGDRRTKKLPLVSLEAGRGENQTQQLKLYFFFIQSVLPYRNPESWYGTDSHILLEAYPKRLSSNWYVPHCIQ